MCGAAWGLNGCGSVCPTQHLALGLPVFPFGPSTLSRDISPKMKHFLRNLREKLAKVIPHLIESQVSLRKIFSPWASLSLRGGTFIYIGISAKN